MAGGSGVTVSSKGGATVSKGAIQTVFKDAVFTPKSGVASPAPNSKNK